MEPQTLQWLVYFDHFHFVDVHMEQDITVGNLMSLPRLLYRNVLYSGV